MRRLVLLAVIVAAISLPLDKSSAEGCAPRELGEDRTANSCGHIGYDYDPRTKMFQSKTQITASDDPDGTKYEYNIVAACDEPINAGGGASACANFGNCPPKVEPDGTPMRADRMQGMRARRQPPGPMVQFGDAICVYTGRSIPMADVVAAVREQLLKRVGRPQITVQPATRGLIHWPMLFSAPPQPEVTLTIANPLPGQITADPSYVWDLGEGQRGTGAGHRYSPAVDPTKDSSDDYYVKGRYDVPGEHAVALHLTWSATINLGPLAVDLDPIVFDDNATARVVSATNRLYDVVPPS